MLKQLHIDWVMSVAPRYVGPQLPENTDVFGCRYRDVDYGTGSYAECVYHPLAQFASVDEIERNYTWPNPDWWDYCRIPQQIEGNEMYPIRGGGSEPFLIYKSLRGQEQAFMDLVEHPEIVHYCLDKLFDLAYENTRRIYEQIPGQVMITYVAEDMGGQDEPDVLAQAHPRVPAAAHEAHDRPGARGGRVRLPPQRRRLPPHPAGHDRGWASTCSTRSSGAARAWSARG